jgi:hypothetical protein
MTSHSNSLFDARDKLDSALALVEMLKAVQFDSLQDAGINGVNATLEAISGLLTAALNQTGPGVAE